MAKEQEKAPSSVTFSPEQLSVVKNMIEAAVSNTQKASADRSISMYNVRDIHAIETVNVKRFADANGEFKFVVGFKNLQNDPMRMDQPKYIKYAPAMYDGRKYEREPFITLILSDGKETVEHEVLLVDYYNLRDSFQAKVLEVKKQNFIQDFGVLGMREGAVAVDEKGNPESRPTMKAEAMGERRVFVVELPGFDSPVEIDQDFLA